jgi:cardiolipin synthase
MRLQPLFQRRTFWAFVRGIFRYLFGRQRERKVHGWQLLYRLRVEVLLQSDASIRRIEEYFTTRVWIDREAFPRIRKLIRRAQHTVVIQMFIWKDDALGRSMAATLLEVADRGVKVDITKEIVGDIFELESDFLTTKNQDSHLWRRFWSHPNIRISHAQHNDHAKVYIIDNTILLLTGMNIADEYHESWHDYLVELRGQSFVEEYLSHGDIRRPQSAVRLVMNDGQRKEIRPTIMKLLNGARESIVVEHPYLSDPEVIETLTQRSKEGIRITIIIPAESNHLWYVNRQSIAKILTEGVARNVEVFFYPRMIHGKMILIDRAWAFVGSANLLTSSLDTMGEVNVLLYGKTQRSIIKLRDMLRADVLSSEPMTSPPHLPWLWRLMAWLRL